MTWPVLSWGGVPAVAQHAHPLNWRHETPANVQSVVQAHGTTLPFGNGRSYGDSCLAASAHVLHTRGLNRLIAADWEKGVVTAEAGLTIQELLAVAIPAGWFVPVTPGTQFVTLGGALANDVHGKNHHRRGTFGCHVRRFGLTRSDGVERVCSPSDNAEFFAATIGGLGMTGVVTWVELSLIPIRSSKIQTTTTRFGSLADFFALSQEADMDHEYSVAWVDGYARGADIGRGVFLIGDHAVEGHLTPKVRRTLSMPLYAPHWVSHGTAMKVLNTTYYRMHPAGQRRGVADYDTFLYPLDRILNWNRLYGRRGFQQFQCVVPLEGARESIAELLRSISRSGSGSFLSVLKYCGDISSPGLMSFPMPGVSLAMDFPERDGLNQRVLAQLDDIVRQAKGRLYPAKDAHMSGADFRQFYPNWTRVEALRDQALTSRFWQRVTAA